MHAAKLTNNENFDADNVDSRYEKRFIQKEIEKKAKSLKREEMARINTLVERAMANDPRLLREKHRQQQEKERIANERKEKEEAEKRAKQEQQERIAKENAQREQQEKDRKAAAKVHYEKEKKRLRKARQGFRKIILATHEKANAVMEGRWESMEDMNDDVEFLCQNLDAPQIEELTTTLGGPNTDEPKLDGLLLVQEKLLLVKEGKSQEEAQAQLKKQRARQEENRRVEEAKAAAKKKKNKWTKEELSCLAKAVKKYPPGGANRWDTIALFINNQCKPETPKIKEECIEKYNQVAKIGITTKTSDEKKDEEDGNNNNNTNSSLWTELQLKQLQDALSKYPASSMDKNERWATIAKEVEGKTKKECVEQFKKIREALKQQQNKK
eukprot:CAMPEP_0202457128 /NCGR_PEP_ID=MMETSP1360-20130828/14208_1 /ASSEMBLY_ACC=CAM_ASM_000848 /TAXON_ID=515479 /ORGANISM="Licmophora paradoxa, Strain CCMP2313" /LENGTH=383 /DNA_ID=CAMNT_0049077119 /DNA_START=110 /DNA_END=1261 /DNA_ORIENTATION=+